jgi:transposase
MVKQFIGVDISKDYLDYLELNQPHTKRLRNKVSSIKKWLANYPVGHAVFVLEPTGTYSDLLVQLLSDKGFEIRLASPRRSHSFSRALGQIHKTDRSSAQTLLQMAVSIDLPIYQPRTQNMQQRKQLQMAYNALSKQQRQLKNQLHALSYKPTVNTIAQEALQNTLQTVEEQLKQLENELQTLDDEEAHEFQNLATSVVGIGSKSARLLLIHTNGLKIVQGAAQLLSFVGVIPGSHQSGSSVYKKGRITKRGSTQLRACLYNAAKSAKRYNFACKALYERLRKRGKPHKVAMVAVMKKLLQQVFAVVKSKTKFDNQLYHRLVAK